MALTSAAGSSYVADNPRRRAVILVLVSSVIMSFGGVVVRNIDAADPWQINFYRALGLTLAVALIIAVQYRQRALVRITAVGRQGIVGGVLLALAGICFLQSITSTTVANTLFVLSAIPFFAAALAWLFLGERPRMRTLATMLLAALGILVMLAEGIGVGTWYGNAMAVATALCFATFAVIVRSRQGVDMLPAVLISGLLIVAVCSLYRFGELSVSLNDLLLSFFWGSAMAGVANWLFVTAARALAAAEVTLFMLLEFALGPLWAWLFVHEIPSVLTVVGGILVMSAVAFRALAEIARPRATPSHHRYSKAATPNI